MVKAANDIQGEIYMGLDMFVREIRTWEKRELGQFAQSVLKSIYNVNNPNLDVNEEFDIDSFLLRNPTLPVPYRLGEELVYWRKYPDVHGWMKNLFFDKGGVTTSDFNHDVVFLTVEDAENLKTAIVEETLPTTSGFFFGDSEGRLKENDLEKVDLMLDALSKGSSIYYTSSW